MFFVCLFLVCLFVCLLFVCLFVVVVFVVFVFVGFFFFFLGGGGISGECGRDKNKNKLEDKFETVKQKCCFFY